MSLVPLPLNPGVNLPTSGTVYMRIAGSEGTSAIEAAHMQRFEAAGNLSNFNFQVPSDPGAGNGWTFTLRKNGADVSPAMTVQITTANWSARVVNSSVVAVTKGDLFDWAITVDGTPPAMRVFAGCSFDSTTPAQSPLFCQALLSTTDTEYLSVAGGKKATTESIMQFVMPCAGTLSFGVTLATAPGGTDQRDFWISVNGSVVGAPTLNFTGAEVDKTSVATIAVVAGDLVTVKTVPTDTPLASHAYVGLILTATVEGEFALGMVQNAVALNATGARYSQLHSGLSAWTSSATIYQQLAAIAFSAIRIYALLSAATNGSGGSGKQYTFALQDVTTADESLDVVVLDAASGNGSGAVAVGAGDQLQLKATPSGTPDVVLAAVSICGYNAPVAANITINGISAASVDNVALPASVEGVTP